MKYLALYNSPYVGGGVEQVVRNLVDHFSDDFKRDLCLLCNDPSRGDRFEYGGVQCVNLKTPRQNLPDRLFFWGRFAYSRRILQFLKQHAKDGDVVNIHGIEYALFPGVSRAKIPARIRLVMTVHGSNFDELTQYVVRGLPGKFWPVKSFYFFFRWLHYLLEQRTCRRVDGFTFINRYNLEFYATHYGVDRAKAEVIYNGLNLSEERRRKPKTDRQFLALIVGSTVYRKGLDRAIAIVERLNRSGHNVRLQVVGFADFPAYRGTRQWDFVDYVGRVAPDRMAGHYDAADFLLFPSRFEGFPLTVLEALQHRLPVVVSRPCVFDEIPGHENFGLIVEGFDDEHWAQVIAEKLFPTDRYNDFVQHLNRLDLSTFAWAEIAAAYERLLARAEP